MSGLAHILEANGISTVVLGLIPQHIRRMRPPRALVVPFELGRPFGAPNHAELQREVLDAALECLDTAELPPHTVALEQSMDANELTMDAATDGWACPVVFPDHPTGMTIDARVSDELRLLRPWYERGLRDRGSTAVGASGLDIDEIPRWLAVFGLDESFDDQQTKTSEGTLGLELKLAVEDLKAFYLEAATAQPGRASSADTFDWFWTSTSAAELLRQLRDRLDDHPDAFVQLYALFTLVPEMRPTPPEQAS